MRSRRLKSLPTRKRGSNMRKPIARPAICLQKSPLPQAHLGNVADQPGITATALQVWMQTSHPTMPNIIVAPKDMRNVIAYILSLKGREGSTP